MRVVSADETGLVKRVEFGHAAETAAVIVKYRGQDRTTAPLVASFDRGSADGHERSVLLGLADGSIELLDLDTSERSELLPPGTFAHPIVSVASAICDFVLPSAIAADTPSISAAQNTTLYHQPRLLWLLAAGSINHLNGGITCVAPRVLPLSSFCCPLHKSISSSIVIISVISIITIVTHAHIHTHTRSTLRRSRADGALAPAGRGRRQRRPAGGCG